jgi:hypothetical protein
LWWEVLIILFSLLLLLLWTILVFIRTRYGAQFCKHVWRLLPLNGYRIVDNKWRNQSFNIIFIIGRRWCKFSMWKHITRKSWRKRNKR